MKEARAKNSCSGKMKKEIDNDEIDDDVKRQRSV